jgi:hypothetical protein
MTFGKVLAFAALLALVTGCSSKPTLGQLSGKVTFQGKAVPAGWLSFTPEAGTGEFGQVKVLQIKDGLYDSAKERQPGIYPGPHRVRIAGFDGKKVPLFGQGKQIFNPVDDQYTVPPGSSTKDFVVPASAGQNVKIQPTADD